MSEFVPVLTSYDVGLIALARSVLDAAGIPYLVRHERDASYSPWVGLAALSPGLHTPTILVESSRAEEARALLAGEAEVDPADLPGDDAGS